MPRRDDIDFEHSRAILIGVETYEAGFRDRDPVPAARSLEELRDLLTGSCEWPDDRVETLLDPHDSGRLLRTMTGLIEEVSDVLIFYYVGHGQLLVGKERHDLGLALPDTREDPARRDLTSLRFREVRELIERVSHARIKIFILDCCCSGIATKYGDPGTGSVAPVGGVHPAHGAGTYVWTACGHSDEAFFEPGDSGLTYFTKFLSEAIREAHDAEPPGAGIPDLHSTVKRRLADSGAQQIPRLVYSGEPDQTLFVWSRRPGSASTTFTFKPLDPGDPRTVGSYHLKARLGGGGLGRVFLAFTSDGGPVAVKLLRTEFGQDTEFRKRFGREIGVAQGVRSRFVAPVLGSDSNAPDPWLACAYVCGPSLLDLVREAGPLRTTEVLAIAAGIAKGLDDIHNAGAIHRDLKPANVMVDELGPKIIDFGIAKALSATQMTRTNVQLGTPAYKSPEQATGREVTARSDVFSLGSTLYFLATGKDLFDAEDPLGVIYQIAHEEPNLEDLEPELRDLVRSCLAKTPADRPAPARIVELCARAIGAPLAPAIAHEIPTATPLVRARMRALRALDRTPVPEAEGENDSPAGDRTTPPPPLWTYTPAAPPTQMPAGRQMSAQAVLVIAVVAAALICVVAVAMVQTLNRTTNQSGSTGTLRGQSSPQSAPSQQQVSERVFTPPASSTYTTSSAYTASSTSNAPDTASTTTSYTFAVSDLNDSSTDITPQTPGAMLPDSFTDSDGRTYNLMGSSSHACANSYESETVSNILSSNHCSVLITGAYVSTSGNILVSANIVVLPNANIATSVGNQLATSANTGDLGWHCPKSGAGSGVCDNQIPTRATMQGWHTKLGRYVLWTDAIYVDETTSGDDTALNNGSKKASLVIGPDHYWFGQ